MDTCNFHKTDHDWEPFGLNEFVPICFPEHIRDAVQRYLAHGDYLGGYLTALFEGRGFDAVCSADPANFASFAFQLKWIAQCAPTGAYGSPKKVTAWMKQGGLRGKETD